MRYTATEYAKALYDLVEESTVAKRRTVVREVLETVSRNGSLALLPEIVREFGSLSDRKAGVRSLSVRTPERLSELGVARKLHFKAKVTALRDVQLGGGAVVEIDDLRVDNSVRARMGRAREAFTK